MAKKQKKLLSIRLLQPSVLAGLRHAYRQVQVDPAKYIHHIRRVHKLPIRSWDDMFLLGPEVIDPIANRTIVAATRIGALEGMGFGVGGLLTILPDMGILSAITIRLLQKLSLLYGFEYATDEEVVQLWMAAGSAAGLDLGREFIEKQAIERLVPRIMDRVAAKMSGEIVEKWSGRVVPVLSAGFGGALNYYFVRSWGRRAQKHFLKRHRAVAAQGHARILPGPAHTLPSRTGTA
jgi:EcsC protein family